MQEKQRVADMAVEVLARQAGARAAWTRESLEDALKAVLETEAGQQLAGLQIFGVFGDVCNSRSAVNTVTLANSSGVP